MNTMEPPRALSGPMAALHTCRLPYTLVSKVLRQSSNTASSRPPNTESRAAMLTTASNCPKRSTAASIEALALLFGVDVGLLPTDPLPDGSICSAAAPEIAFPSGPHHHRGPFPHGNGRDLPAQTGTNPGDHHGLSLKQHAIPFSSSPSPPAPTREALYAQAGARAVVGRLLSRRRPSWSGRSSPGGA